MVKGERRQSYDTETKVSLAVTKPHDLGLPSERTATVATAFGLPMVEKTVTLVEHCEVTLGPGRIVFLVGPSGSGKSSALAAIAKQVPGVHRVDLARLKPDRAIIDLVAPWDTLGEATSVLAACGLSEPRLWVRPVQTLSEGEAFRARLASVVASAMRAQGPGVILCDEFCASLHRRVARSIGFSLRRIATRRGLCFVLACCNDDIAADLRPDTILRFKGNAAVAAEKCAVSAHARPSLLRRLVIEPGRKADYNEFAAMHYRPTDELGFVDKVFVLRERASDDLLGIVVYSHGPLELSLRNRATQGWFSRNPKRVNKHLRILRRLVIHPDIRGCGFGHYLVRKTLPLVGTDFVECLAAMGAFHPVFERAGMERIGQYEIPPGPSAALQELKKIGIDPNGREFSVHVGRQPRVRRIISKVVYDWYQATTAGGERRVARQTPTFLAQTFRSLVGARPVYYLWRKKSSEKGRKRCA